MNNMTAAAVAERARAPQAAFQVLPDDGLQGTLVGRVWVPSGAVPGPRASGATPDRVALQRRGLPQQPQAQLPRHQQTHG